MRLRFSLRMFLAITIAIGVCIGVCVQRIDSSRKGRAATFANAIEAMPRLNLVMIVRSDFTEEMRTSFESRFPHVKFARTRTVQPDELDSSEQLPK